MVYKGPMFGGKTARLIDAMEAAEENSLRCQAFRPMRDTRDADEPLLRTYDGRTWPATRLETSQQLLMRVTSRVVAIDEANMWDDGLVSVVRRLASRGIQVHIAGLNLDFRGVPFEPMPTLLSYANKVEDISAECGVCKKRAWFTQRLVDSEDLILPGGANAYAPRCAVCFRPPKQE